jgi:hypothetical protein
MKEIMEIPKIYWLREAMTGGTFGSIEEHFGEINDPRQG